MTKLMIMTLFIDNLIFSKARLLSLLFLIFFCAVAHSQEISLTLKNTSNSDRIAQVVEIPLKDITAKLSLAEGEAYIVKNNQGAEIISQTTYDGFLIIQTNISEKSSSEYKISTGERKEYKPLVFGRFFPERYDDFAWENDKLGFRLYGSALKKVQAPANGLDLWYKRTARLVLEDWYKKDISKEASYHVDHGEGCDPYAVGPTLGGGAMAPFIEGDSVLRNINFDSFEMLDNGPLRVTAKLFYPTLSYNGVDVEDTRIVSLDAGSYFTKIMQDFGDSNIPEVAAGFVKRAKGDSLIVSKDKTHLLYVEPMSKKDGQIYLALVFKDGFGRSTINSYPVGKATHNHVLAISRYEKTHVTYYTGFGWNKSEFRTLQDFERYTQIFVQQLNQPLKIIIK